MSGRTLWSSVRTGSPVCILRQVLRKDYLVTVQRSRPLPGHVSQQLFLGWVNRPFEQVPDLTTEIVFFMLSGSSTNSSPQTCIWENISNQLCFLNEWGLCSMLLYLFNYPLYLLGSIYVFSYFLGPLFIAWSFIHQHEENIKFCHSDGVSFSSLVT